MATGLVAAVILVSGIGGIVSSLLLRRYRSAWLQGTLAALAAALVVLLASADDASTVAGLAVVSWALHVAVTYAVVKEKRRA